MPRHPQRAVLNGASSGLAWPAGQCILDNRAAAARGRHGRGGGARRRAVHHARRRLGWLYALSGLQDGAPVHPLLATGATARQPLDSQRVNPPRQVLVREDNPYHRTDG
jgi:hypothetical protein